MDRGVAGDRDGRIAASPRTAIADGGTKFAIGIDNGVSGNSDIVSLETAANACTAISACRDVSIAFNADVFCFTVGAAADARTILTTAAGSDLTALNCNIGSIRIGLIRYTVVATADTSTIPVAACQQLAGVPASGISVFVLVFGSAVIVVQIVLDGQSAVAVLIRFFDGCVMSVSAENGVVAVQLKVGVAIALDLDGCRAGVIPTALRLNVHILQGHIGGLIFRRIHCDGIFGLFAVAGDGDAGIVLVIVYLCVLLRHIGDAVLFGLYRHTALVQIVSVRKGCCGDGRDHCHQRSCRKYPQGKLFFHIFPHCKTLQTKKLTET